MEPPVVIALVYLVGLVISIYVYRVRAGLGIFSKLRTGSGGVGVGWLMLNVTKAVLWPLILGVWLARGRPAPGTHFTRSAPRAEDLCTNCGGSGQCSVCNGSGETGTFSRGTCTSCRGTKDCVECRGTGLA